MSDLNIYQRINSVMKAVKYVRKDATVQGYKAVSHDQVLSVCRQALVDNGIVIVPTQNTAKMLQMKGDGAEGKELKMSLYEAEYTIHFVNIDKPEDKISIEVSSQAQDNGDKAPGKALSYAVKYALLKVLCLETGENDESRAEAYATLTPTQVKGIKALLGDNTSLESRILSHHKAESVEQILKSDYSNVVTNIKKAKKAESNNANKTE